MKKGWLSGISIPLYLLVIVFNMASWIDIAAVWTEMPLLVNRLPEGWELPAYFILIINGAKALLIVYVILKKFLKDRLKEYPFVYAIIAVGASCLFILGFLWDRTSIVAGKEVSLAIMILIFLLSSVDCLSGVVFLPYLSIFRHEYITAYFVGEGICQLVPAVVGIIQGVGETPDCQNHTIVIYNDLTKTNSTSYRIMAVYPDPKFSVQTYFVMMSCIMVLSGIAFTLIHYLTYFKRQRICNLDQTDLTENEMQEKDAGKRSTVADSNSTVDVDYPTTSRHQTQLATKNKEARSKSGVHIEITPGTSTKVEKNKLSKADFVFSLVMLTWTLGLMYGLMPGIQSYSALPYGNRAFNLSLRIGIATNPIVSFLALFVYTRSKLWISVLYLIGTAAAAYQVVLACLSPQPPLKGTHMGELFVV